MWVDHDMMDYPEILNRHSWSREDEPSPLWRSFELFSSATGRLGCVALGEMSQVFPLGIILIRLVIC